VKQLLDASFETSIPEILFWFSSHDEYRRAVNLNYDCEEEFNDLLAGRLDLKLFYRHLYVTQFPNLLSRLL
jgi:hypothetical protein